MPIIPWIEGKNLIVPLVTALLWGVWQYACWYFFIFTTLGTAVISMDAINYIPGEYVVPLVGTIVATALVLYVVFYLVSYQDKKAKVRAAKLEALQAGTAVDEVSEERVKEFHFIYKIAMFLGVIVTSAISFALMAGFVPTLVTIDSALEFCIYGGAATIVVFVLFDYFIGRPIADGTFKAKVLQPVQEALISKFQPAETDETPAKEVSVSPAELQTIASIFSKLAEQKK